MKAGDFEQHSIMKETLTIGQIRATYPDQWVLVGNPDLGDPTVLGSVVSKLVSGTVLYSSKNKREIADKAQEFTQQVERFTCVYTGEMPKNRRIWL